MSSSKKVPDVWDDEDWEVQADRLAKEPPEPDPEPRRLTRAELMAKHAEENRRLWEEADAPQEPPVFVSVNDNLPLTTPFKQPIKVLSRKPTPHVISRKDPITGMVEQLTLRDDEDDEEKSKKQPQESPEEIRQRQQRELEEKQRRYQEARAKIFGESNPSSGQSSPGSVTPPEGRLGGSHGHRGRGRGRGGRGRGDRDRDRDGGRQDRRQTQLGGETRELYDPKKGGYSVQRRGDASPHQGSGSRVPKDDTQPIRSPRGPDGSGRGFGFARRGRSEAG